MKGNVGGNPQQRQMQVDLTTTTAVKNSKGTSVFKSAVILRKISKYVAGTDADAIMPIPVFIDPYNDKIVADGLPMELRADPSSFSDKDWDIWNSYMVHRFISMNQDYVDIVNEVQQMHPQSKKEIYSIYKEYIPKNNKWNKYIKSNVKQYKSDLLKYLSQYWECSQNEVKEYLNFLDDNEILRILNRLGVQRKEINQLL